MTFLAGHIFRTESSPISSTQTSQSCTAGSDERFPAIPAYWCPSSCWLITCAECRNLNTSGLLSRLRQESGGASGSSVMFYKRTLNYSARPHLPNGLLVPVDAASPHCVAVGHRSALIYLKQAWSTERGREGSGFSFRWIFFWWWHFLRTWNKFSERLDFTRVNLWEDWGIEFVFKKNKTSCLFRPLGGAHIWVGKGVTLAGEKMKTTFCIMTLIMMNTRCSRCLANRVPNMQTNDRNYRWSLLLEGGCVFCEVKNKLLFWREKVWTRISCAWVFVWQTQSESNNCCVFPWWVSMRLARS